MKPTRPMPVASFHFCLNTTGSSSAPARKVSRMAPAPDRNLIQVASPVRIALPSAAPRQANCYYSSSDAAFADRYQARAEYGRIARGTVALEGGWRVYSSGAGIALSLILRQLLGLAFEADTLRVDPVLPRALDGLRARIALRGRRFEVTYRVGPSGCGVRSISLNGHSLGFSRESNPHRAGAARVPAASIGGHIAPDNTLGIEIG